MVTPGANTGKFKVRSGDAGTEVGDSPVKLGLGRFTCLGKKSKPFQAVPRSEQFRNNMFGTDPTISG